ncbi:MAG: T9SS type A sorting domain-containing protein [Chitinophagaceae bacterium]|nr:T9SS type A sorting domain-containing protein [Chitinophagaceae bacterium]
MKKFYLFFCLIVLAFATKTNGQTYYSLSSGDYTQDFNNWSGYATNWNGLPSEAIGSIPASTKRTVASNGTLAVVTTSPAIGYDVNPSTKLVFLSTGSSDNTSAVACDLNLDFSGRNAGTLSFDADKINNGTGGRSATLRVYYSTDGTTWTELTGTDLPFTVFNNVAKSAAISVSLPAALNNASTVKFRFYYHNGTGGATGSRPKITIDNLTVTSTPGGGGGPATQLIYQNAPTTGIPNISLASFNVKAVAIDGISVDNTYTTDITISKASGPGNLTGTLVKTPISGIATFNDLKFDAPGTYTLTASSGSLTQATTASIIVADASIITDHFRSNTSLGNWSSISSWESSHDSATWMVATLAPDNNAASIVVQGIHELNVDASVSVSKLRVDGIVNILASKTFTIVNDGDAGTKDFIITIGGTVLNQGTLTIGSGATWQVNDNASFIQNTTSGISSALNSATLEDGSYFTYRGSSTLGITPSISGKTYSNLSLISESGVWRPSASGSGTFTVKGHLFIGNDVRWNLNGFTGTLLFNGNNLQNFNIGDTAITLNNVTLNNTIGLVLQVAGGKLNITNTLDVQDGTLTTGGMVVLKSDATRTARIAPITTGIISGNITVERFIPAKATRKWSLLSSPVTQSLANSWQQQIHITGAGTGGAICPTPTAHSNGFDATETNTSSIYTYNAAGTPGSRWTAVASTYSDNLMSGKGFRVNVRGDRSLGCDLLNGVNMVPSAVTLKSTGAISNSDKNMGSFSITYPNVGINNYVLVGNPYPSALSFSGLQTANSSSINTNYAVYIPASAAGVYSYWDGVSFTGGSGYDDAKGNTIASGQAVFVQSLVAGDITLNYTESQKDTEGTAGYFKANTKDRVRISLNKDSQIDEVVIRYANDATISNTSIGKKDIPSMNYDTYITSLKGSTHTAVQTRSLSSLSNDEVWLNVGATQSGNYSLRFSQYEDFAGADIYLVDHLAKVTQDVKANPEYVFSVDVNNAATKGSERFSLVFSQRVQPLLTQSIKMYPNPASQQVSILLPQTADNKAYSISVTDMAGKVVMQYKANAGTSQMNIGRLTAGTYLVEVTDSKGNRSIEKLIKN